MKPNKKYQKKPNVQMEIKIFDGGVSGPKTYNFSTLDKLLIELNNTGVFKSISIPVYAYRNVVSNDSKLKGTTPVGFVNSYKDGIFNVSIFGSYINAISSFDDPEVRVRVQVEEEEPTYIVALNIVDAARNESKD